MTSSQEVPQRKRSSHIRDARMAGLYDLEHTIGQGHFAVVKLARHVFTGEKVACKIIDKTNLDPESTVHIMQEVRCMKLVQHPNIVRLYEVIDTHTKLFLCLELGDYDMHDFIVKHEKGVAEPLAQQYFCQIITAIDYCHRLHVVHRDLKPENVVFFEKLGMVKLTDFGFSNLYEPGQQLRTSCGSLAYSAPEILLGDAYDAPAVDVWSLGVIVYMLVCGRLPFQETNDSETLTRILDCKYSLPDSLSTPCKNLIQRMLVRDPPKRASLPEIVANPWVAAGDRGLASALPLIVQHHLPHSAHTTIIEQMVVGNVASEDAILSALENDEYSSLTATYYLLAERILSSCREERAKELAAVEVPIVPEEEPIDGAADRSARPSTVGGARCRSRSNSWRARPCSILKEESEEELSSYLRSASRHSSRNSSPSVSMFGGSARDRISPQAVHDLLEFSRIGSARRAASPDSIRSSRSPSPPGSGSGRTSPAVSTLSSFSRLKVASSTPGAGMRKLSSSPHLLGICEEGEEGGEMTSSFSLLSTATDGVARTNRSASTGLVHGSRHGSVQITKSSGAHPHVHPTPNTYSAVRMIRPRHAVVSPDVCRRYEQHQRYIARSRRSTSCSSSEASDDEEGRRLTLIGSKHCGRRSDGGDREGDDDDAGHGGLSGSGPSHGFSSAASAPSSSNATTTENNNKSEEKRSSNGATDSLSSLCPAPSAPLLPIPEMPQLDSDKGERIRARLLHRSHTAERILRDWAGVLPVPNTDSTIFGTPPREVGGANEGTPANQNTKGAEHWIRRLQRTRSHDDVTALHHIDFTSPSSASLSTSDDQCDLSMTSSEDIQKNQKSDVTPREISRDSDSGCSSARARVRDDQKTYCDWTTIADEFDYSPSSDLDELSFLEPHLIYDQPRREKVNVWLRASQFV